jgi:cytochrome c oxidase subunit 2
MVDTRHEYLSLHDLFVPIAVAVWVLFMLVVVFAVARYRQRGERAASQTRSRPVAESLYALGLLAIAAFLCVRTFRVEDRVDRVSSGTGVRVHVVASRWNWRFEYPDLGVISARGGLKPSLLVVPQDTTIQFTGTATDVIHSFWVPARRFKRDLFPRATQRWDLMWPTTGWDADGECGEFCGLDHARMHFTVHVVTRAQFDRWVRQKRAAA